MSRRQLVRLEESRAIRAELAEATAVFALAVLAKHPRDAQPDILARYFERMLRTGARCAVTALAERAELEGPLDGTTLRRAVTEVE